MIRSFTAIATILVMSSLSFAGECNTPLKLTCQAIYQNNGSQLLAQANTDVFADEHWDEPSLKNCASTVYVTTPEVSNTTVRVYAEKDLNSNVIAFNSSASIVIDKIVNGQKVRGGGYSNEVNARGVVGQIVTVGLLNLPKNLQTSTITDITVTCTVK